MEKDRRLILVVLLVLATVSSFKVTGFHVDDGSAPRLRRQFIALCNYGSAPRFKRPVITDRVALVNDSMRFACKVRGIPKPFVVFFYKGQPISTGDDRFHVSKVTLEIINLRMSDSGQYACKAYNEYGELWGNTTLNVINSNVEDELAPRLRGLVKALLNGGSAPRFKRPVVTDRFALVNDSMRFMCKVRGNPKPFVVFFYEGQPISPGDDRFHVSKNTLEISNLRRSDSGQYACKAYNEYGELWGNTTFNVIDIIDEDELAPEERGPAIAALNCGSAPRFKRPVITDRVALVNDSMRFACKVRGNPKPFVVFFYKGQPISPGYDRFHVSKNTLEISNLRMSDSGQYACKAYNEYGELWGNTTLNVINIIDDHMEEKNDELLTGAPEFSKKRDAVDYLAKPATKSVTLDCECRGYPTPTIVWYKGKQQIYPQEEKYIMEGWKLEVNDLKMEDMDNYTCVISNEYGSIIWTTKVKVLRAPKFSKKRDAVDYLARPATKSVTLDCECRGYPTPTIVWYKGKQQIYPQEEKYIMEGWKLEVNDLKMEDMDNYTCVISNEYGSISWTTKVKDLRAPEFSKKRDAVDYLARPATKSVTLDCECRGYPTPTIVWYKGKQQIYPQEEKYIMEGWKLEVNDLKMEDIDNYTCVISNEYGSISWTTKVKVLQRLAIAPIIEDVKNQTVVEGENATFTCKIVKSDSQPLLQWLKHLKVNDSYVNEKGEPYVHILQQSGFKKTIDDPQYLTLYNVTEEDQGWYTCLVVNTVGMTHRSAYLEVLNVTGEGDVGTETTFAKLQSSKTCSCDKELIAIKKRKLQLEIKRLELQIKKLNVE